MNANKCFWFFYYWVNWQQDQEALICKKCVSTSTWAHCGMKAESETAYCCCIHSVYSNEREVEGAAVSGCAARDAGQPAAERKPGVGFEVVVEWLEPVEMEFGDSHHHDCPAVAAWSQRQALEDKHRSTSDLVYMLWLLSTICGGKIERSFVVP